MDFVVKPINKGEYFTVTLKDYPQITGNGSNPAEAAVDLICHLPNDLAIEAFEDVIDGLQTMWALQYFAMHAGDPLKTRARTMIADLQK